MGFPNACPSTALDKRSLCSDDEFALNGDRGCLLTIAANGVTACHLSEIDFPSIRLVAQRIYVQMARIHPLLMKYRKLREETWQEVEGGSFTGV